MDPSTELTMLQTIAAFFQEGGFFMYVILAVFLTGVVIAAERFIYLFKAEYQNRLDWVTMFPLVSKGHFSKARNLSQGSSSALASIVHNGLSHLAPGFSIKNVETAMEEGLMEAIPKMERRTNYIATLANIATLLGLLGTILGLISAFTAVTGADPTEKANLLSASISVAMNTTAFGLMSAIPLLLAHALIQGKATALIDSMEMASIKVMNFVRRSHAQAKTQTSA